MSARVADNPFEAATTVRCYSAVDEVYRKSADMVIDLHRPVAAGVDARVIDLGAGTGVSAEALLEAGVTQLSLADPSAAMLDQARHRLGDAVNYVQTTAEGLGLAIARPVDLVYALNCVHLFPDHLQAFAGVASCLKPAGTFVLNLTAPVFHFDDRTALDQQVLEANLKFYQGLNTVSDNPMLPRTIGLLEEGLDLGATTAYTQARMTALLHATRFRVTRFAISEILIDASSQQDIWRMISKSFADDAGRVERLIESIRLPEQLPIKQAVFVAQRIGA